MPKLLAVALAAATLAACAHETQVLSRSAPDCSDGTVLSYRGEPVGCVYTAQQARGRGEALCSDIGQPERIAFVTETATTYSEATRLSAHPEYFFRFPDSCLVCIHRPLRAAEDELNQDAILALGGWDAAMHEAFEPSVECLGYWDDNPYGVSTSKAR